MTRRIHRQAECVEPGIENVEPTAPEEMYGQGKTMARMDRHMQVFHPRNLIALAALLLAFSVGLSLWH